MPVTQQGRHYNANEAASRASLAAAARGSNGQSSAFNVEDAAAIEGTLAITAISGTTPTLDVSLETSNDGGLTWDTVGSFPQKTVLTSEVQSLTSTATGGTVKLLTENGPTAAIAFNAPTATVQAALDAVLGAGAVVVSGAGPLGSGALTLTWADKRPHQLMTVDNSAATGGTAAVSRTTAGAGGLHIKLFGPVGQKARWKWVVGGTGSPSFTFKVTAKAKR